MKIYKSYLNFLFWTFAHVCHGQFFYSDYQIGEEWFKTNTGNLNIVELDTSSLWYNYLINKGRKDKSKSFGFFFHLQNEGELKSIYQRSDLIGNGILTNYKYKTDNLELVNSMFFTDSKENAKRGFVRTIKDVTIYTNQAYAKVSGKINDLTFSTTIGRNFLNIVSDQENKLLISNYSRPFDQLSVKIKSPKWQSSFSIIELDTLNDFNRYLYLHTLSYVNNSFIISAGEGVLDSGKAKSISFNYLNPFHLWSWENISGGTKGVNSFLFVGFTWFPYSGLRLFGELLIDDINFHKKDAFYLNRYGYLLGYQQTGYPKESSNINLELSSIMHQVYQSYHPSHRYTHRGFPIGHFLGNDFINLKLNYSHLVNKGKSRPYFELSYLEDGANGLDTPFDNPYEVYYGIVVDYKPPGHPSRPIIKFYEIDLGYEINIYFQTYLTISPQAQSINLTQKIYDKYG